MRNLQAARRLRPIWLFFCDACGKTCRLIARSEGIACERRNGIGRKWISPLAYQNAFCTNVFQRADYTRNGVETQYYALKVLGFLQKDIWSRWNRYNTNLPRGWLIGAVVCAERGANIPLDFRTFLQWMSR
jgi:hypothetical protein